MSVIKNCSYRGSAVQQAISTLTDLPADIFNGSGAQFYTFGFEYWTDPAHPEQGYITWQANGKQSLRVGANSVDEDPLPDGSGVGRRLIPEEPMVRILPFSSAHSCDLIFPAAVHQPQPGYCGVLPRC